MDSSSSDFKSKFGDERSLEVSSSSNKLRGGYRVRISIGRGIRRSAVKRQTVGTISRNPREKFDPFREVQRCGCVLSLVTTSPIHPEPVSSSSEPLSSRVARAFARTWNSTSHFLSPPPQPLPILFALKAETPRSLAYFSFP